MMGFTTVPIMIPTTCISNEDDFVGRVEPHKESNYRILFAFRKLNRFVYG